ncbi:helical backbone metal receptor [Haliangium ochraceum]|uniref:Periplasmic binding protein n=1 Tax=Haliangium ochraceum (strain DSM 14365 / JCM 11303 / SMP-2) TaxID=502025 RepID=D0LRG8_HALO1|nr:helical backbone metal receptor [Haliangium ochraceum]ACY17196.1 periplasmic binding protein [Haliangium ochraceum DSM 14365]
MAFRIRDDRQRELLFARPPQRIVSLVPSDTETVFALGAGARLVGRTRYCVEPATQVEALPVVGGTKDIDIDAVAALAPDLVLCNQEENARAPLEKMAQMGLKVYVSFPHRVAESLAHVARLARLLGVGGHAPVRALLKRGMDALQARERALAELTPVPVFVPIWMDPLMTMNADTYGSDMLALAGARNVFHDRRRRYPLAADLGGIKDPQTADGDGRDTRYPRVSLDEVRERAPAALLLPDEPHAFDDAEAGRLGDELGLPGERVLRLDGKDLFWYGVRSVDALARLADDIAALRF